MLQAWGWGLEPKLSLRQGFCRKARGGARVQGSLVGLRWGPPFLWCSEQPAKPQPAKSSATCLPTLLPWALLWAFTLRLPTMRRCLRKFLGKKHGGLVRTARVGGRWTSPPCSLLGTTARSWRVCRHLFRKEMPRAPALPY